MYRYFTGLDFRWAMQGGLKMLSIRVKSFPKEEDKEVAFVSFPEPQSTCKGKNKSLMLVNCLPLLYLKQQI